MTITNSNPATGIETVTVTIDGIETQEQAILTTIANNKQYGGGMQQQAPRPAGR